MAKIVDETLGLCGERFTKHQVALRRDEIPAGLALMCRPSQIMQVLLNLLSNAYDAAEATKAPWIELRARTQDGTVELRVSDSGSAISPAIRHRLMEPFFTTKEPGKGTGLGLSISLGIAEAHEGSLTLDETAACTTFVLRLPLAPAEDAPGDRS